MLLNINSKLCQIRNKFKSDKRGVTAVEYAIIAVTMSGIILAMFSNSNLQTSLENAMSSVTSSLSTTNDSESKPKG